MKRLFFLALIALAAWYGWKHYPEILSHRPSHEAVVENDTGHTMTRVRLSVGGQTFVRESIPDGKSATIPFKVNRDATFTLVWEYAEVLGEHTWKGGMVPAGPMVQRHIFTVDADNAVFYRAENK